MFALPPTTLTLAAAWHIVDPTVLHDLQTHRSLEDTVPTNGIGNGS